MIDWHHSTKIYLSVYISILNRWFLLSADAYGPFVIVYLVCCMLYMGVTLFYFDLVLEYFTFWYIKPKKWNLKLKDFKIRINFFSLRNSMILTSFCCCLWWQLLSECHFYFCIVFSGSWHPRAMTECAIAYMTWIGLSYQIIYKSTWSWWLQICNGNCIIMDLLLSIWIWIRLSG